MKGWERVRFGVRCAYGCQIQHAEWAWFGRHPFVVCEPCAAKYGIHRPEPQLPVEGDDQETLVPASPERHHFTSLGAIAAQFEATPDRVLRAARKPRKVRR